MPPSLYANLLDPSAAPAAATISGAPVKYSFKKEDDAAAAANADKKAADVAASLRFQPSIKRPQAQQKPKTRPNSNPTVATKPPPQPVSASPPAPAAAGPTIQKWRESQREDFDVVNEYHRFQEEQKARLKEERKAKRAKNPSLAIDDIDWSAPYNVQDAFIKTRTKLRLDAWKHSDSKFNARYQWKQKLHQFRRPGTPPPARGVATPAVHVSYKNMPPPQDLDEPAPATAEKPAPPQPAFALPPPPPAAPPVGFPPAFQHIPPPPPLFAGVPTPPGQFFPQPPPSPFAAASTPPAQAFQPPPPPPVSAPSPSPAAGVISREAVRYEQPISTAEDEDVYVPPETVSATPEAEPESDDRSNRPGQKGFAQRYMEKMGWKKGQGLGKDASGITTILRHETSKRKRKPDAEGGGWAQPAAMGRIVGGKKAKTDTLIDETKAFSLVAKFDGMLKDMDVDRAIEEDNLMQQIGEKMEHYGRSERVYVDRDHGRVFVKFTSALSAFNAIKASDGIDFLGNGRIVQSTFFNADKFEEGVYE